MKIAMKDLKRADWNDLKQVVAIAEKFGPGMSVIRRPGRNNYNIVHTARADLLVGAKVLHRT